MEKKKTAEQTLSRRKALGRIGLFATAAYTVPAFATLSMARASSGTSEVSDGALSDTSDVSEPSENSGVSAASNCEAFDASAEEDLADAEYVQCMVDGGLELPADFTYPTGVTLADGTIVQ